MEYTLFQVKPMCNCKKAKLQAGIKPTALCSAIDKENSIEFPLDFLHYCYESPKKEIVSCAFEQFDLQHQDA